MKAKIIYSSFGLIITLLVAGCGSSGGNRQLEGWLHYQEQFADTLNKRWGGPDYIIEPLKQGTQFPLGTFFYKETPFQDCQYPQNVITNIPMDPLPVITVTNSFSVAASVPPSLAAVIRSTLGANFEYTNDFYVSYGNLTRDIVYGGATIDELTNNSCHTRLLSLINDKSTNRPIIVESQINGTLAMSSSRSFDLGATATVTNVAGVTVQYNSSGGFSIQQTNATPWFGYYSTIDSQSVTVPMTGQQSYDLAANVVNSANQRGLNPAYQEQNSHLAMSIDGQTKDVGLMAAELEAGKKPDHNMHKVELINLNFSKPSIGNIRQILTNNASYAP